MKLLCHQVPWLEEWLAGWSQLPLPMAVREGTLGPVGPIVEVINSQLTQLSQICFFRQKTSQPVILSLRVSDARAHGRLHLVATTVHPRTRHDRTVRASRGLFRRGALVTSC